MRFGTLPLDRAEGAVLAHSLKRPGVAFRKGRRLSADDVAALRQAGISDIVAAQFDDGDVLEDAAAKALAQALAGPGVVVAAPFTGRCNLFAAAPGLARIDTAAIAAINAIDEAITVATLADYAPAPQRGMLATIKIIPFAAPKAALAACIAIAEKRPGVSLAPYSALRAALVQTTLPGIKDSVLDGTEAATAARLASLGGTLAHVRRTAHAVDALAREIGAAVAAQCDPILVLGASAIVDRHDVIPAAIAASGGTIERFGMPVDPGNLLLLGRIGTVRVIGLPGCARSPKLNGFDWVLQRFAAGIDVDAAAIAAMGVGGLLAEIPRPTPRAGTEAPSAPRITALVLAAGKSSRMAPANKLFVEIDGRSLIDHAVAAATGSQAAATIVVLGNEAARARAALAGRSATFVENPDYASGLASSLRAGLGAVPADCDGVVVLLADMPGVTPAHVDRLIAAFSPLEGRAICVAARNGKRGNPVLWAKHFFAEMAALDGDQGARSLIRRHEDAVCEVDMPDDGVLTDLDTPEALGAYRAAQGKSA
ncbi:MAG: molybdopterin-binding/glycosyltransferase family 2 protein [Telmatospirillum sp.]|nr:molybdopterin-binding/glycosyltransferase family 2 protein [Telmatospirillum sp.]